MQTFPRQLERVFNSTPALIARAWARFACAVLFAGRHHHVQHQTQVAYPVGVQRMAGPARLVGVIADLCAVLLAMQGFDGGIDVQDP